MGADSTGRDSLTLYEIVRQLVSDWAIIAVAVMAGLGLAAALAFIPRPTYKAEAILAPTRDDLSGAGLSALAGGLGGLASIVGISPESGARQSEAVLIMQSRSFASRFIEENELLPTLFADDWDAKSGSWTGRFATRPPTDDRATDYFLARILKVKQDAKTGTVRVSMVWRDPEQAADWVNRYVARLNELVRLREIDEANQSLVYLRRELEGTGVIETRAMLYRLIEAQLQKKTLATVRHDFVFRVLDPAHPPELDAIHAPKRVLLLAAGLLIGALAGIMISLLRPRRGVAPVPG